MSTKREKRHDAHIRECSTRRVPPFPEKRSSNRAVEPQHGWSAMNVIATASLVDKGRNCVWIPSCLGEGRWRVFRSTSWLSYASSRRQGQRSAVPSLHLGIVLHAMRRHERLTLRSVVVVWSDPDSLAPESAYNSQSLRIRVQGGVQTTRVTPRARCNEFMGWSSQHKSHHFDAATPAPCHVRSSLVDPRRTPRNRLGVNC